jgi:tripartite-type tricarboxylate transporter receptor subunit TctC
MITTTSTAIAGARGRRLEPERALWDAETSSRGFRESFMRAFVSASVVFAITSLCAGPCAAQGAAEFYKDKTIAIVMGTGPGGSYDLYGRTIAEHLGRHIPGNPNIIIEHMPGAGGVIAANHIYGPAPQDGSKILLSHPIPMSEMLEGGPGIRFESRKFNWLGAYDAIGMVLTLWQPPGLTVDELKTKDFVIGSMSKGHLTYQWAMLLKTTLGTNYKVITGYPSGNHLNLAMERGEIHGWTIAYSNLAGTKADWLRDKKVALPVQFTLERMPDLRDVPTLLELAPADKKDVVEFITSGTPFGRALAVGPGVPAERVALLRKAFDDLMRDPAFLADASKRKLDIAPLDAAQTHALVDKIASASPALIARVKKAIGQTD